MRAVHEEAVLASLSGRSLHLGLGSGLQAAFEGMSLKTILDGPFRCWNFGTVRTTIMEGPWYTNTFTSWRPLHATKNTPAHSPSSLPRQRSSPAATSVSRAGSQRGPSEAEVASVDSSLRWPGIGTSASLVVTSALLVVTKFAIRIKLSLN